MLQRSNDPLSRPFDEVYDELIRGFGEKPIRVDFHKIVGNSSRLSDLLTGFIRILQSFF